MAPEAGPPTPPPEAELVRLAREAQRISPETAAARAETQLSGSRWRQIEAGWRKDTKTVVIAKAATLAHMAYAVGVSPERLEAAGRNDAAEVLREVLRQEAAQQPDLTDPHERAIAEMTGIDEDTRRDMLRALRAGKARQRRAG